MKTVNARTWDLVLMAACCGLVLGSALESRGQALDAPPQADHEPLPHYDAGPADEDCKKESLPAEMIAEDILQIREMLGGGPIAGSDAFDPLPLCEAGSDGDGRCRILPWNDRQVLRRAIKLLSGGLGSPFASKPLLEDRAFEEPAFGDPAERLPPPPSVAALPPLPSAGAPSTHSCPADCADCPASCVNCPGNCADRLNASADSRSDCPGCPSADGNCPGPCQREPARTARSIEPPAPSFSDPPVQQSGLPNGKPIHVGPLPFAGQPHTFAPEPPSPQCYEEHAIVTLREAAMRLDETAHMLECLDLFERADHVRETAQGLRLDARRMHHELARRPFRPVHYGH